MHTRAKIGGVFTVDFLHFFPILPVCSHSDKYRYLYMTRRSFTTSAIYSLEVRLSRSSVTTALASHLSLSRSWDIRDTRLQDLSYSMILIYRQYRQQIAILLDCFSHCKISQRSQVYAYLSTSVRSTIHTLLANTQTPSRHLHSYSAV